MLPELNIKLCEPSKRHDGVVLLTIGRNTRSIPFAKQASLKPLLPLIGMVKLYGIANSTFA